MLPTTMRTADNLTLRCHQLSDVADARAQVVVLHGLGDHGAALPYRQLAQAMQRERVAVSSMDHRGHGLSEGPRVFAPSWRTLRDDVRQFVSLVRDDSPARPTYLLGLSMGGLLALDFARYHGALVDGVIAVAPALDVSGAPRLVRMLLPALSVLAPRQSINPGLDLTRIARDDRAVVEYTNDPLFQQRTTPRLAAELLRTVGETLAAAHEVRVPLLVLHGTADVIAPAAGSALFCSRASAAQATRITYDGAYHNLFLDSVRDAVFGDISAWLVRQSMSCLPDTSRS